MAISLPSNQTDITFLSCPRCLGFNPHTLRLSDSLGDNPSNPRGILQGDHDTTQLHPRSTSCLLPPLKHYTPLPQQAPTAAPRRCHFYTHTHTKVFAVGCCKVLEGGSKRPWVTPLSRKVQVQVQVRSPGGRPSAAGRGVPRAPRHASIVHARTPAALRSAARRASTSRLLQFPLPVAACCPEHAPLSRPAIQGATGRATEASLHHVRSAGVDVNEVAVSAVQHAGGGVEVRVGACQPGLELTHDKVKCTAWGWGWGWGWVLACWLRAP